MPTTKAVISTIVYGEEVRIWHEDGLWQVQCFDAVGQEPLSAGFSAKEFQTAEKEADRLVKQINYRHSAQYEQYKRRLLIPHRRNGKKGWSR